MKISKTALLLAIEHHIDQKKCCRRFSYIFCYVIVQAKLTMETDCQRKWHHMRGSRNFRQSDKKALTTGFFLFFFLVFILFNRSQMVNFKEIYHFSRCQRGSNIFQGESNFFRGGGSNLRIPYRNLYNL